MIRMSFALVLLTLSGCATVSKSECQTGDWYDIGVRDGANGYGEERFLENAQACAKHGVTADRERWLDGRMRGLERYCTPRNGFDVGARNNAYAGVCGHPGEEEFLRGYNLGRELADARGRLAHWNGEIHDIQERLDRDDKKDKADNGDNSQNDKQATDDKRLTKSERVELGIRLGVAMVRREGAQRECAELEARGQELQASSP
jgi:Protein of unknown function (DUF2799)